jgi:putative transcriptional regulator
MLFKYRGAGLDNVYLKNGYTEYELDGEKAVSIDDAWGLHRAIASALIHKASGLTGAEFRFLRVEMDLTQHRLARQLGVNEQTVASWEKGVTQQVPGSAERLMRLYAGERLLNEDGEIAKLLEELAELDHKAMGEMCFEETQGVWAEAA